MLGSCKDERLTAPLAKLIKGRSLSLSEAKGGRLACAWGKSVPLASVTIESPPVSAPDDPQMRVVDEPRLTRFGATARAKATQFAVGDKKLYIVAFTVTSDRYRILVNYSGEDRRDQDAGDAAVLIAELLHTT